MATAPLRVGIIGCGSAGPAAALFLKRAGHEPEIFERAPALLPVGTGFLLQPTGLRVLDDLGMRQQAERAGAEISGLDARTRSGRSVLALDYDAWIEGLRARGMHRATLLHFFSQALERAGVPVHTDAPVTGWQDDAVGRWLHVAGSRRGPFDLVVVANGARSEARQWIAPPRRARRYPWGAFWTIRPDPNRVFRDRLWQVVDGSHEMVGFLPTGTRYDDPSATPLVSVFWSVRVDEVERLRKSGARALNARIRALEERASEIVDPIDSIDAWSFAEYLDVVMPRWHDERGVVLGDAAHAMSPQLGQGVNLALTDAAVLAESLAAESRVPDALARYSRERRHHLAFYQRATRWLTPFFQSSIPGAARLRDWIFPALGALPPLERQMIRSMAGVKRGILRRSLQV